MITKLKPKKDKYKSSRGGYSRIVNIHCQKCNNIVATYQKDGPGNLRRMYLDRIFFPEVLVDLQYKDLSDIKPFTCTNCGELLGIPYIYKKETRKAFKIIPNSVIKKLIKNS